MENKTIMIEHVVVKSLKDGKMVIYEKDKTKNKKSTRPYPLLEPIYQLLVKMKQEQYKNQLLSGSEYCIEHEQYVLLDNIGRRLRPGYVSNHYKLILRKKQFKSNSFS